MVCVGFWVTEVGGWGGEFISCMYVCMVGVVVRELGPVPGYFLFFLLNPWYCFRYM